MKALHFGTDNKGMGMFGSPFFGASCKEEGELVCVRGFCQGWDGFAGV